MTSFDVCVVCALGEEAEAFIDALTELCGVTCETDQSTRNQRDYRYATIKNKQGEALSILVTWPPSYGPIEMGIHLASVLEEFKPRFVAMTGICAGDKNKVKLGDIVVAERAFAYDSGKIVQGRDGLPEQLCDTNPYHPGLNALQFARMFHGWESAAAAVLRPPSKRQQREWLLNTLLEEGISGVDDIPLETLERHAPAWRQIVHELQQGPDCYLTAERTLNNKDHIRNLRYKDPFPFIDPPSPACHIAPMASGSAVRSDNPFTHIQVPARNTIAIDMEGAAFYRAVADHPGIHSLLVKGVCDYADSDKDDSYHRYAATLSAIYMVTFIKEYVTTSRIPELGKRPELSSPPQTGSTTYNGHTSYVVALDWQPRGSYIASAGGDGTVQVWHADTKQQLSTYRDHPWLLPQVNWPPTIYTVAWSPDGLYLASAGVGKNVFVWNAITGKTRALYEGHCGWLKHVFAVAWSPDGKYIASACSSASWDKTIHIWEIDNSKTVKRLKANYNSIDPNFSISTLAWSPDGKCIAAVCGNKAIRIWDSENTQLLATYHINAGYIFRLAWSPDGKRIAIACENKRAQIWDVASGQAILTYYGHADNVRYIAWSPDGTRIATASNDKTAQVWNAANGDHIHTHKHDHWVTAVAWSPDGTRVASASNDKTVQIWDANGS
ncbi:MAG TPA: hypothetical protein VKY19_21895 [Ktedonosporobacter sp.]|jgi:nucleoside phosphorylase/Tol biopolymer transport system component|nr:hypothetical protein [Ktedonosporobacter sp.]